MADETLIGDGTGFQGCLPALTPIVDVIYKSRDHSLPLLLLFVLAPLALSSLRNARKRNGSLDGHRPRQTPRNF